jgi:hypothetical protein
MAQQNHWSEQPPRFFAPRWVAIRMRLVRITIIDGGCRSVRSFGDASMIARDQFSRLRLREFCPGDTLYADEADEHGDFFCESIRGIDFARPVPCPDDTFIIDIDLLDHSTDAGPAILARLGIPLSRKSTIDDITAMLGQAAESRSHKSDAPSHLQTESYDFCVGGDSGYNITCTFLEPGARDVLPCYQVSTRSLWQVRVARSDLHSLFPEEPQRSEYLEPVVVEPACVGSPECFVDDVSLLAQPTARDRIGLFIGFRLLPGMSRPRVKLLIHNSAGQETTMIWLADATIREDGQYSLAHCIDRLLLPSSIVEFMIEEQDGKVLRPYRLPLAGFRIR